MVSYRWCKLKGVYSSEKAVEREYKKYEDDPDFSYYDYYEVKLNDLDDYPDEYELAMDEGFIDFNVCFLLIKSLLR